MAEIKDWITEMIEREATPKATRTDTVLEFATRWGIAEATYYYQASKVENSKQIIELALNSVKRSTPEVLEKLKDKAESGDLKAIEMFLDYVLKLSKNLDIKSDGKPIPILVKFINGEQQDNI